VFSQLEQIVIFAVMGLLVALFAWIYFRDRQLRIGLWMLGWIFILIHFATALLAGFSLLNINWTNFLMVATLEIAGMSFTLSVSEVYATTYRRTLYILFVGVPSLIYLVLQTWAPRQSLVFGVLVVFSTGLIIAQIMSHYGPRKLYPWLLSMILGVPGAWVAVQCTSHHEIGVTFYLSALFGMAGLLYLRHHKRFTPGVITTSISFFLWASVFPLGDILQARNMGPPPTSVLWDLPKYLVAVGMILTLFETETALATNAARQYRNLFEGNLAGVYLSTVEGRLLDCNSACVEMYGYSSKEEMLNGPAVRLYADVADREEFVGKLLKIGLVINYECRQRKKDGSIFWILERATVITDHANGKIIEGTVIDITERKQAEIALKESEERFAAIFRHSPVGCGIVSLEGVFLDANDALLKMFARPAEQVIGKTGVELGLWKSQDDRDTFYQRLRAEGSIKNMEIEYKDPAGNKHTYLYFGTVVRIGEKECIFGMQLECTEQRELEARFLQAQKMEAVGRLAGGVAHDFNNLLGVIGGYAELLEARLARDEKLRNYCTRILETTQRASGLTGQLLTFSRKEISRPAPLKPDHAIRELATILPRLIGEDIEIILQLGSTGTIVIDKTHFEQIIFNIVVNARDAMPRGGQLFIKTNDQFPTGGQSSRSGAMQYVVIKIRDTGIGMDERTRRQAFEPFFTTKETGRGTGLGLSTVYGIVHQCGGEISIESRPGAGTEISILLPATAHVEAVEHASVSLEPLRGSGHILLVEDETELRKANAEFLTSVGYTVTCAGSGPEALKLVNQIEPVDLVITDVVMPKMNGREFANRLLELRPGTKVLFISGYADDIVLQAGISRLGTPFLQKPYSLKQFGAKVQELLAAAAETVED
jgi:two-component system, cell cycle sensor histidine kinase and response regulator CckA